MYNPSLKYGVISFSKLTEEGYEASLTNKKVVICERSGEMKMIGEHFYGL